MVVVYCFVPSRTRVWIVFLWHLVGATKATGECQNGTSVSSHAQLLAMFRVRSRHGTHPPVIRKSCLLTLGVPVLILGVPAYFLSNESLFRLTEQVQDEKGS